MWTGSPRLLPAVGALSLLAGGTAAAVGVYREMTFECEDALSVATPDQNEPAEVGETAAAWSPPAEERQGGGQYRGAPVEIVCSGEARPYRASLLRRGGTVFALVGVGLAVAAVVWERSE